VRRGNRISLRTQRGHGSLLTMAQRLTDKAVKVLAPPARGNTIAYDIEVKGFGVRITAAGTRAFVLNYRRKSDALERRYTIGSFPDWSTTAAREEAKRLKREVDSGGDPVGEHVANRAAPTVADLCVRFDEEHIAKQRPHTQTEYRAIIRNSILPALGKMKVTAVDFEHVERLHADVTKRAPILANRTLAVTAKMFTLAIKWRLRTDHPCKSVERNREHFRKRYLRPDELIRLTKALADDPNQQAADVFRLLLLTGARKGEALSATWDQFDLVAGVWTKPHALTKQKTDHRIPLSAPARQLLARLHQQSEGLPWVFPGRRGRHREDTKYAWARICKTAGITGLRVHDLRHSYASTLAGAGVSLPTIGALLGHSMPSTTARYAHLMDDPLRAATERAGAIIAGKESADVVPLKGRA
jgi:integrase